VARHYLQRHRQPEKHVPLTPDPALEAQHRVPARAELLPGEVALDVALDADGCGGHGVGAQLVQHSHLAGPQEHLGGERRQGRQLTSVAAVRHLLLQEVCILHMCAL
jgi:hypothetical protein